MLDLSADKLKRYDVSRSTGFLPSKPVAPLEDSSFAAWEAAASNLPELIRSGRVEDAIASLPDFDLSRLRSENEWRRAHSLLSFLANAWIWGSDRGSRRPRERVPPVIAIPFLATSAHHGLPPSTSYATLTLWNFHPISSGANDWRDPDSLECITSFTGSIDEEWFYTVPASVEFAGAEPFRTILDIMQTIADERLDQQGVDERIRKQLESLSQQILELSDILDRMWEKCTPSIFYAQIRPFFAGAQGMEEAGLPRGILFDTGDGNERWCKLAGGTAAQSSLFAFFDVALGVSHVSKHGMDTDKQLQIFRRYMPERHRDFLEYIAEHVNIRRFCLTHASVQPAYDDVLAGLTKFRERHLRLVARYIISEKRRGAAAASSNQVIASGPVEGPYPQDEEPHGTGGAPAMAFLKQSRDETQLSELVPRN